MAVVIQDKNMTWKLLAIRAGYIRLGLIPKVLTSSFFPKK